MKANGSHPFIALFVFQQCGAQCVSSLACYWRVDWFRSEAVDALKSVRVPATATTSLVDTALATTLSGISCQKEV